MGFPTTAASPRKGVQIFEVKILTCHQLAAHCIHTHIRLASTTHTPWLHEMYGKYLKI
eukprot:TRINITY_DN4284_c0_g1_i1.p3 TRINITY_DN4284_c0_g1~~TRINITY_DN4284_c0_g1_i1.p3  ORF type:complete len:58 (+),score=4.63 TRINITY_DN4284_c0_g1_i1:339-512(+)